jgi:hypothetical protein
MIDMDMRKSEPGVYTTLHFTITKVSRLFSEETQCVLSTTRRNHSRK